MVKKIRIQKLDDSGILIEDRLVDQQQEFYSGPKEPHSGPLKVELCLFKPEDVEGAVEYLLKLKGNLPIEAKAAETRGRKKVETQVYTNVSRELALEEALSTAKDQDEFISNMRELGYIFLESERLSMLLPETYKLKERHLNQYQWLVRLIKEAKDPRNDKHDLSLLVGISIMSSEDRNEKMVIYQNGTFLKGVKKELPAGKKMFNFSNTNLIKYPHYMIYEEREKWGVEHKLLMNNPEKKPTKFYQRWLPDITLPEELKIKN